METTLSSKTKTIIIGPDHPFVMIGERINPTGRKKLGAEMAAGDFSRVRRDAETQVAAGAQMLDVNAGVPLADEAALLVQAIQIVGEVTDTPLCIDSSVMEALEAALSAYEGKALINSVTGEDERLERILPLVKKHNAAVIGMANDETGISMDPEVRVSIAEKIIRRAQEHGIARENVIIDPLVLTVAADPNAARVTLQTMQMIHEHLGVNMVCGAGNVSFGLPDRPPLTAAFLAMAMTCGLTCAITDATDPIIRQSVRASDVLLSRDQYAAKWIKEFRQKQKAVNSNQ
ncbi:MAG: dihydropteroate synthase [Chloroflexi bacterium]|nr:dihydropteroate synthase [Chloroflexota bacterium]